MKKLAAPLQAFAMFILCSGMAWMVFVLAGFNPAPPTAMDLQARNTQDLSFANMNSTAVALAKQMLANMVPSPSGRILLPVTGGETAAPSPVAVITLRSVSTFSNTATPFSLYTYLFPPTATREKPDKPAVTATYPLMTTKTLHPPTLTATTTPVQTKPPSPTPLPPTLVDTPTNPPTNTPRPPSPTQPLLTNTSTPRPPSPTQPPPSSTPRPPSPTQPAPTNTPRPPSPTQPGSTSTPVPPATSKPTFTPKPTHTPKRPPPTSPPSTNPPATEPPPTPLASTGPQSTIADRTQPGGSRSM